MRSSLNSGRIVTNRIAKIARAALLLALVPGLVPVRGYVLEGQKWPQPKTSFASVVPGRSSAFTNAMKQAMADWTNATTFTYVPLNQSAGPCKSSGTNGVGFSQNACGRAFGSTTLAVTISYYTGGTKFVHAGTVFNANKNFSVYSGNLRQGSTDFRRVAVHELGHALGLDHETQSGVRSIMTPFVGNIEKPQPDDIAGVKKLYP